MGDTFWWTVAAVVVTGILAAIAWARMPQRRRMIAARDYIVRTVCGWLELKSAPFCRATCLTIGGMRDYRRSRHAASIIYGWTGMDNVIWLASHTYALYRDGMLSLAWSTDTPVLVVYNPVLNWWRFGVFGNAVLPSGLPEAYCEYTVVAQFMGRAEPGVLA